MKKLFFLIFLISLIANTQAQTLVKGKVVDQQTKEPLPFVNVGVLNKNIGTVSDENGLFQLVIPEKTKTSDTLKCSYIGFESYLISVGNLLERNNNHSIQVFELSSKTFELKQVVVKPEGKLKTKILGNKTTTTLTSAGFSSNELGSELGIYIKIKKSPTYLRDFNFSIANNKYDTLVFRVNIYQFRKGKPQESLLTENIIVTTTIKTGVVSVDLKPYQLVANDDILISLEWIKDLGDTSGLYFSAGLFNGGTYIRKASQGDWKKVDTIGLGLNVTVEH
jgi:hypothetical protein